MGSTWTAIADPIFYFGVHWHIDKVFDEYRQIQSARDLLRLDEDALRAANVFETEDLPQTEEFTPDEREQREKHIASSVSFNSLSFL